MATKKAKKPLRVEGTVKVHKGTWHFPTRHGAENAALKARLPLKNIVDYQLGFAVQLHKSGPYLGPSVDPRTHRCKWCPAGGLPASPEYDAGFARSAVGGVFPSQASTDTSGRSSSSFKARNRLRTVQIQQAEPFATPLARHQHRDVARDPSFKLATGFAGQHKHSLACIDRDGSLTYSCPHFGKG